jgi:predicted ATPase
MCCSALWSVVRGVFVRPWMDMLHCNAMIHLQTIKLRELAPDTASVFPFRVPAIRNLAGTSLALTAEVTFFVGENGSGKSTLLEAIASAARSITVGSESTERDPSLSSVQTLANQLKLTWKKRTHRGFFMRSEDFFGYARKMQALRAEFEAELRAVDNDPSLSDTARAFGRLPYARSIAEMKQKYGDGLDYFSHGESFFTLFKSRFVPHGLYLLDEPEAPLSPMRQLAFISMLKAMVAEENAQFIIATHSPILMAFPDAMIYSFDEGQIQQVAYDQVPHVAITRDFLSNPKPFLRHL